MIIQKFLYRYIIYLVSVFFISCNSQNKNTHTNNQNNSLQKLKDTIILDGSTEGEQIYLYINKITLDSIIESEILGETGKERYSFTFNNQLKKANHILYSYEKPIYLSKNIKLKVSKEEDLYSSKEVKQKLNKKFMLYHNIFFRKKIDCKWFGKYTLTLNQNNDDWREIYDIKIDISKDSIVYEAKGYQLYQRFLLSGISKKDTLFLYISNIEDNIGGVNFDEESKIIMKGEQFFIKNAYINSSSKKTNSSYKLEKERHK